MYASTTIDLYLMCSLFSQTTCNEVEGLLLVVKGSLGMACWGGANKVQSRLGIVDRSWSRCRAHKVKSSLGKVLWSRSRSWTNKVQGRLGVVDRSGANRGGNKSKLCIFICLPFWRSLNLHLSLATTSSGSDNSLLLSICFFCFRGVLSRSPHELPVPRHVQSAP